MIHRYVTVFQEMLPYNRIIVEISRYDSLNGTGQRTRREPGRASQQRLARLMSNAGSVTIEIDGSISITVHIVKRELSRFDAWIERESGRA